MFLPYSLHDNWGCTVYWFGALAGNVTYAAEVYPYYFDIYRNIFTSFIVFYRYAPADTLGN